MAGMSFEIYHGDCLEVLKSLEDGSFDAVITDPPYSSGGMFRGDRTQPVDVKYVQTGTKQSVRSHFSGDTMDQRSLYAFSVHWMSEARRVAKPGASIVVFTDWRQLPLFLDALQGAGWIWRNIGTWWKPGTRMQRGRFSSSAEYILYGSIGVPVAGKKSPQNVFPHASMRGKDKSHICQKPTDVMRWALGVVPEGGKVLDPFAGSGSTGEASLLEGLEFVGIERQMDYVEIAKARIAAVEAGEGPVSA
jgi:site-specific DNA-methyltransferase (adenine-specific)